MRYSPLLLVLVLVGCRETPPPDGALIRFPTTQGEGQGRWFVPRKETAAPATVILLHGDHGWTDVMDRHARRLASQGYRVFGMDLYRGEKIDTLLDAHIMDRGLPEDRVKTDLRGAVDWVLKQKGASPERIAILGWDMGGGYALDAAIADPRIAAVITCYGRLTTDPALLGKMKASVLAIMAARDEGNPPETLAAFSNAMKEAGRSLEGPVLFEVDHGFMNPPGREPTKEEADAAEKAWSRIEQFLGERLASP
ncbi:MAG: dienelactone hydrolase family protein [Gemmataceae bacterium]